MCSSDLESPRSAYSGSACSYTTSNSSDGIRGVWYYLTSSQDSSVTSLNTTMPASSTASSSSSSLDHISSSEDTTPETSPSIISLSSNTSESVHDAEMTEEGEPKLTRPNVMHQKRYSSSVTNVADLSDCSSTGSDVIYVGSVKSVSDPCAEGNGDSQAVGKNEMGHAGCLSDEKKEEEVCEQAENKMSRSGDILRGAAHDNIAVYWSTVGVTDF